MSLHSLQLTCRMVCVCYVEVIPTDKEEVAFKDLDAAILVGSMPRKEGMERKDLLKANVAIFKSQGAALDKYAKKTVKVAIQISDLKFMR